MVLNVLTFIFPQRLVFQIKAYNKDIHLIVPCELLQLIKYHVMRKYIVMLFLCLVAKLTYSQKEIHQNDLYAEMFGTPISIVSINYERQLQHSPGLDCWWE
jgi:hypothetical protein